MALPKNNQHQSMYNCVNLQIYYNKVFSHSISLRNQLTASDMIFLGWASSWSSTVEVWRHDFVDEVEGVRDK